MLNMRVSNVINALVEQELVQKNRAGKLDCDDLALHFHLDLRMFHHADRLEFKESRGLHLLYHSWPRLAYVNVFSAITNSPFTTIKDVDNDWTHETSHDSCWRTINVFADIYFEMARIINDAIEHANLHPIPPKDIGEHNAFAGFGSKGVFDWVKVNVKKDPSDSYGYRKLVKVVR